MARKNRYAKVVAPLAGAWIEINVFSPDATSSKSLPSRERGLKLLRTAYHSSAVPVAPLAGAWIEIIVLKDNPNASTSLPSRERGLKYG